MMPQIACMFVQVYYGPQGSPLTMTAIATPDTYYPADLYGPIANSTGYIFPGTALP